ncbi:MAG: S-methyl-5'-thioadenosine phosphorylase [Roseibacillus sp.]|nr:S-methyl-5'-thioadenosine phosphorylase [Roseibacillus sp.]|tara:strand:- start:509 stop:1408 length:900 start_codon:yes stop_codon:yes gene_type:complete
MQQEQDSQGVAAIGVIGGSGLYEMDGFVQSEEQRMETPFGQPSDTLVGGTVAGRQVWFLPRHGKGHHLLPHEINHRANIWALRSLGVRWVICVTAVGSLREKYAPRSLVIPDQYYDRTTRREEHTFFGCGIAAHISFGEPVSGALREILAKASQEESDLEVFNGGTYVNMEGPAFSTRAESNANRQMGFDVIGMTNLPEAKLAREAEMALATLCMVTDYDCWRDEEVSVDTVLSHLHANSVRAQRIVGRAIPLLPDEANWPEHRALDSAVITSRELWPDETLERLRPILTPFVERGLGV